MNNLLTVLILAIGILLIYSAVKGESPKAVVEKALKKGK